MPIATSIFLILSMFSFIIPFLFWFWSNLSKARGIWNWKRGRLTKNSFYVCIPLGIIFVLIGVLFAFI